jgi:hypothetical protein
MTSDPFKGMQRAACSVGLAGTEVAMAAAIFETM